MASMHDHESRIAQLEVERDAAIARAERAEKALEQALKPFEQFEIKESRVKRSYIQFYLYDYPFDGEWCDEAPELTACLCERFGLENPLETEARNA